MMASSLLAGFAASRRSQAAIRSAAEDDDLCADDKIAVAERIVVFGGRDLGGQGLAGQDQGGAEAKPKPSVHGLSPRHGDRFPLDGKASETRAATVAPIGRGLRMVSIRRPQFAAKLGVGGRSGP